MGLLTKLSLISEILQAVKNGQDSIAKITDFLSERPNVLGSDVVSIMPLIRKFSFLEGEDDELKITQEGVAFMNYLQGSFEERTKVMSPTDEDLPSDEYGNEMFSTVTAAFNEVNNKYKGNKEILADIKDLYEKYLFRLTRHTSLEMMTYYFLRHQYRQV